MHSLCPCLLHSQQLQDSLCSAPALCLPPRILCTSEASSQCRESRLLLRGLWFGKEKPAGVGGGTACSWTEAGKLRTTGRTQASSCSFVQRSSLSAGRCIFLWLLTCLEKLSGKQPGPLLCFLKEEEVWVMPLLSSPSKAANAVLCSGPSVLFWVLSRQLVPCRGHRSRPYAKLTISS